MLSRTEHESGASAPTGVLLEYTTPTFNSFPSGIASGPDGALWFTEYGGNKIGRITTAGSITEYPVSPLAVPYSITAGSDGALWFTEYYANKIGRITTTGVVTEYAIPTTTSSTGNPFDITSGPDGALWFTEQLGNKIGRITTSGMMTEYPTPTSNSRPQSITVGPDGALWFTERTGMIGRITLAGLITEFPVTNGSFPAGIATGADGALWFTNDPNQIGRFVITPAPTRSGVLSHIAAGGGWTTVITLVNTSSTAVPVTVAFHNDDGSALSLPVTTTQQGASQTTTAASVSATINPNATLLVSTGQLASTVVGWADVLSSGSLGGYAIFRSTPQTGSPSEGTVPLQSQFPSTVTLPYDNTAGFVMGVALANLSTSAANITATMWDDSGNVLGTQIITIAGSGHSSFVLPTQLPLTAGKRGIVKFQSAASGGITGLGLRFSPFGTFTSVPTI